MRSSKIIKKETGRKQQKVENSLEKKMNSIPENYGVEFKRKSITIFGVPEEQEGICDEETILREIPDKKFPINLDINI